MHTVCLHVHFIFFISTLMNHASSPADSIVLQDDSWIIVFENPLPSLGIEASLEDVQAVEVLNRSWIHKIHFRTREAAEKALRTVREQH